MARAALALTFLLLLAFPADAQLPLPPKVIPLSENISIHEMNSNPARLYGYPGDALVLNTGAIQGMRDAQFGWWDPARPSMLNGDVGAGSTEHPGVLNLGADVSRAVRIQASGITVFHARSGRMRVCDDRGCLDLMRALRRAR